VPFGQLTNISVLLASISGLKIRLVKFPFFQFSSLIQLISFSLFVDPRTPGIGVRLFSP
jgi:hypothetical protein